MKSISQRDIARLLGVNASTVSRALKGLPGVSAELQQKISDLAKTQGYRPNPFAMSLRYGATRTIGIIVPDMSFSHYAHIGGPNHIKQAADRKHGYLEALRERHMPIHKELVKCGHVSFNSGLSDTLHLLSLPTPPDAILADHGLLSLAAVQAIIGRGLLIPRDISVIGFMSDWVSGMSDPRITFVKHNPKEIGRKTFKLLLEQIKEEKLHKDNLTHQPSNPKHLLLNAWLNIRESTLPIRNTTLPTDPHIAK